jgi:predicted site-specific integrase-resolvase
MSTDEQQRLLTVVQAADYAGVAESTLRRWIKKEQPM